MTVREVWVYVYEGGLRPFTWFLTYLLYDLFSVRSECLEVRVSDIVVKIDKLQNLKEKFWYRS